MSRRIFLRPAAVIAGYNARALHGKSWRQVAHVMTEANGALNFSGAEAAKRTISHAYARQIIFAAMGLPLRRPGAIRRIKAMMYTDADFEAFIQAVRDHVIQHQAKIEFGNQTCGNQTCDVHYSSVSESWKQVGGDSV